jgi:hypothetical protein
MKKLFEITLVLLLIVGNANAFTILTDTNDLQKTKLTDESGQIHFEWLARLKSDGGNYMHSTPKGQEYTTEEKLQFYKYMGPGFVFVEEGSYTQVNYVDLIPLTGHIDAWMVYNEKWMFPRFNPYVPYDTTDLWETQKTVLRDDQIEWSTNSVVKEGYDADVTVHTRRYNQIEKGLIDHALENQCVNGAVMELVGAPQTIKPLNVAKFIEKVLGMNKMAFLLLVPNSLNVKMNYTKNMTLFIAELRRSIGSANLSNPDLFIIVANYGITELNWDTKWFGPGNSIESTIKMLKKQPEWIGHSG